MKKFLKRIAALLLVALVGVSSACSLDELEQPEWLEQALCDHVFDEEEIIKEPTCVQNGKKTKICSSCGKTKITTIRATGEHVYDDGVQDNSVLTSTASWNERETAGGASVIDGSQAKLHKVVGNTVVVGKDENGMNGKIVNTSFGGIKSTSPNGEESVLEFAETELPYGAEIDFSANVIQNPIVQIKLTGDEDFYVFYSLEVGGILRNGLRFRNILPNSELYADGFTSDGYIALNRDEFLSRTNSIAIGFTGDEKYIYWIGALDALGVTSEGETFTEDEKAAAIGRVKDVFKARMAAGRPVTFQYTSTNVIEENISINNKYAVWKGGTETVLGNDGAEDGALCEITTSYVCGCIVCGQLKVDEETCSHEILTANGTCFVCGFDFSTAPTTAVNINDEFFGWYRGFSFEDPETSWTYRVDLEIFVEIEDVEICFGANVLDSCPKKLSFSTMGAISYSFELDCTVSGEYFYVPEKTVVDVLRYDDSTGESRYIEDVEIKGIVVGDIFIENSMYLKRPLEKVIL